MKLTPSISNCYDVLHRRRQSDRQCCDRNLERWCRVSERASGKDKRQDLLERWRTIRKVPKSSCGGWEAEQQTMGRRGNNVLCVARQCDAKPVPGGGLSHSCAPQGGKVVEEVSCASLQRLFPLSSILHANTPGKNFKYLSLEFWTKSRSNSSL